MSPLQTTMPTSLQAWVPTEACVCLISGHLNTPPSSMKQRHLSLACNQATRKWQHSRPYHYSDCHLTKWIQTTCQPSIWTLRLCKSWISVFLAFQYQSCVDTRVLSIVWRGLLSTPLRLLLEVRLEFKCAAVFVGSKKTPVLIRILPPPLMLCVKSRRRPPSFHMGSEPDEAR